MYQPNFCAECGAKVVRERWHLWTSRRFCEACAPRFRKGQLLAPVLAGGVVFSLGLFSGRVTQTPPPPLVIEQPRPLAATNPPAPGPKPPPQFAASQQPSTAGNPPPVVTEIAFMCGARTKKGTPCTRRVRSAGRCWQHTGQPAMLPPDQLVLRK